MKKDREKMNKRKSELTDSMLELDKRVKARVKCIKELESKLATSGKEVARLSP